MRARTTFEDGIRILRETGELKFLPPALIFCGIVISLMGEFAHARVLVNEGVELAGGFLRNGDENEAAALIFLATENSACTDVAKQRGEQLKAKIHQSVEIRTSTKETMETLLARMID